MVSAENTVLVAMVVDLIAQASFVVDMLLVAIQAANLTPTPDTFKANTAVEVLTLLEEESTIGPPAHHHGESSELSRVSLNLTKGV